MYGHAREDGHPVAAHETALDLVRLDEVLPHVLGRPRGHGLDEMALVPEVRVTAARLQENAELADERDLEASLLEELALRRVLDGLVGLDSASRHHSRIVGLFNSVEDEQLVR